MKVSHLKINKRGSGKLNNLPKIIVNAYSKARSKPSSSAPFFTQSRALIISLDGVRKVKTEGSSQRSFLLLFTSEQKSK